MPGYNKKYLKYLYGISPYDPTLLEYLKDTDYKERLVELIIEDLSINMNYELAKQLKDGGFKY